MDLPDCPPGAEGYEDSVVEMPNTKKPEEISDVTCTKAEQEFQDHLSSLKIRLENGESRPMVERRGRDISGKWIYLCYPCAAVCSGELTLQGHISGRKHKTKLGFRNAWPVSIFDEHPFNQGQKTVVKDVDATTVKNVKDEMENPNKPTDELDDLFGQYRNVTCHIQYSIDAIKAPMIGIEYLVEHPPQEEHYEPSYICTLCTKQGHPRTIINHMTCFWHRFNYLNRHFQKATHRLKPLMNQATHRDGIGITLNRLAQRIEDKYGRLKPLHIDKDIYEKEKDRIMQWIFKGHHLSESLGATFEEVVDPGLIESLNRTAKPDITSTAVALKKPVKKDPSPPRVAAPKAIKSTRSYRNERRLSLELSDISDDERNDDSRKRSKPRWEPYNPVREAHAFKSRYALSNMGPNEKAEKPPRPPNYEYKVKLSNEKRQNAEDSAKKMLAYHEKNPEKHPLYPEEWKKFWNRRYKEIQAEGKDPSKHDFKPEWIVFWTKRMKELHDEELRVTVTELYRKMNISPPDMNKRDSPPKERRRSSDRRMPDRRQPSDYRKSPDRRRSPVRPQYRDLRREPRREPEKGRPLDKRRSQDRPNDYRMDRNRSPGFRPIPEIRQSPPRHRSPLPRSKGRSPLPHSKGRSPLPHSKARSPLSHNKTRSRSPLSRRSPARTNIVLDSMDRSRSPLSRRNVELQHRNRSPAPRHPPPSMQTVLVSDDEFKPDDSNLSPWNSDNDIDSVCSVVEVRSVAGSAVSRNSRNSRRRDAHHGRAPDPHEMGPVENVVATLRMLVALEDYLGSIGPKIVDILTEALKMEKEKANSSEELLERETAVVLIETAKEKLKGAAQAGLVASAAAPAVRAAIVRAAATLHEADTRMKKAQAESKKKASMLKQAEPVPVAGVGAVDRAQIAQQMAAALIAQGKTDVTSEELAQLVDAVVGMAEAKKRETAEAKTRAEAKQAAKAKLETKMCGTATALQMLQSAYDENDKKEAVKEEVPDAMDGLSDSDLETLLKNFNELSAEEQHSLIAYLKKLEAREPQRVERLRQYVSAAATTSASTAATTKPEVVPLPEPSPVTEQPQLPPPLLVESDDDDYTVEDVIESAQQKVKEDQMRKEIEIVKKSLEELKEKEATPPKSPAVAIPDLSKNLSAASDLLALVQASIQSKAPISAAPSAINTNTSSVVVNSTQPRSFGDLPANIQALVTPKSTSLLPDPAPIVDEPMQESPIDNYQEEPMAMDNFNDETYNQNDNQAQYNQVDNYNQGDYNQGDDYNQGNNYNQVDTYNQGDSYNQSDYNQPQSYNQSEPYNQGGVFNQEPFNQNDNYNQTNFAPNQNFNNQNQIPTQNQSYAQPWANPRQNAPMNQAFNNFNQAPNPAQNQFQPRGNFPNGRQEKMNKNHFGNFNNGGNNFRGRGRGGGQRGQRGRGRGRY